MIDGDKIPSKTLDELFKLFGEKEAERILNNCEYNYNLIQIRILIEKMKRNYGENFWIYFWIFTGLVGIGYFVLF